MRFALETDQITPGIVRPIRRGLRRTIVAAGRRLKGCGCLAPAGFTLYLAVKGLHPALPGWPCPLRSLTGVPCPTCFLTRATAAALSGQLGDSLRLHAFGPAAAFALLLWSVLAIRHRRLLPFRLDARVVATTTVALLLYWLVRLLLQYGYGLQAFVPPAS